MSSPGSTSSNTSGSNTSGSVVNVHITFRNTEATDALKSYASEKFSNCLHKFAHGDTEAHVVLRVEKNFQVAEISARVAGADLTGKEESSDLYSAIDRLVDSFGQQLRKHKEKLTAHH
jgi:putative sigma-54 modulation protein